MSEQHGRVHLAAWRTRALAGALGIVAALLAGPAEAQIPEPPPVPQPGPILEPPSASLAWSVPARFGRAWEAAEEGGSRLRAYVHPRHWTLQLDACRSSGAGERITRYQFTVRGVGFPFGRTIAGTACRRRLPGLRRL